MTKSTDFVDELRRAREGDAVAATRLIAGLYGPVRRAIAMRAGGYPDDLLADATQEAMACVCRHLNGCRAATDAELIRWAMVVGWHEALRYLRSPSAGLATGYRADALDERTTAVADVTAWLQLAAGAAGNNEWSDGDELPSDRPLGVLLRIVTDAYSALATYHADVLWRRAVLGAPYQEIAMAYVTTHGAAKRRFQRATAVLRRAVLQRAAALAEPGRTAVLRLVGTLAAVSHTPASGSPLRERKEPRQ